ncbi:hypothetical protein CK203_078598 [Vitis vinifera]|uniref:Uncharacterized protein n=1 Tax=Vitis vinifera TaxID=29760 RepID=A0A438C3U2_VITVI|nr:hypothetical protein CK203_078598 [Vitis vinifera]
MKRFSSSVSLAPLVSVCSPKEIHACPFVPFSCSGRLQLNGPWQLRKEGKNSKNYPVYDSEFQAMLDSFDEEDCAEETGLITEKKKRLSFDQVKALERSFEIENKLEPERKLRELKAKLQGGNMELNQSVKEEALVSDDSSGVLKNESNFNAQLMMSPASSSSLRLNCASLSSPSPMNWFPSKAFQHQFGRMEEQSFFSAEEPCNFFWGDQAPSLHWYFPDQ